MKKLIITGVLFLTIGRSAAQNFYGLQNSNFNGVHSIYINPAGIADSRYKVHGNLVTFGTQFANDYMTLDAPFGLMDVVRGTVPDQYKNPDGSIKWDPAYLKENLNGQTKNVNFGLEMRGPAGMINLGNKLAFAVGTRTRTALQVYNVSEDLIRFAKSQLDSNPRSYTSISDNRFALNMNAYQEISATAAMMVVNRKSFYIKGGATVKYLMGLGSAYVINNGIDFKTLGGDSILINRSDISVGHTNTEFLNRLENGTFAGSLPTLRNINGSGLGFDFGAVFEYRPDLTDAVTSKNRYLLKGGLSLLDWGKISYGNNMKTYSARNTDPVLFTQDSAFSAAFEQGLDSGLNWLKAYARDSFNYTEGSGRTSSSIPTTLNIQLDWNIFKMFYLGMNWTQSVVTRRDVAIRRPSSFVLLPRIETRLFEFTLPLSVYNDYKEFGVGAYARIGPVFFGTDNLLRSTKNTYRGFDFYFGISTGIPSGKAKKN